MLHPGRRTREPMKTTYVRKLLALAFLVALASSSSAQGQGTAAATIEDIQGRIQALKDVPQENTEVAVEAYQQALAAIGRAADAHKETQRFAADAAEAPVLIAALQEELARPPTDPELVTSEPLSLRDLEIRF
jgi:TolA-binding protein